MGRDGEGADGVKKTVAKLRPQIDNMMVDAVKSGEYVVGMVQKLQLK